MLYRKRRGFLLLSLSLVIVLGLASRRPASPIPSPLALHAGDTLWATAAYLGFGLLLPSQPRVRLALLAGAFAFLIELSQLFHPPWLDALRQYRLGGLILGFGFLWSDLVCYAVGILLGLFIDSLPGLQPRSEQSSTAGRR